MGVEKEMDISEKLYLFRKRDSDGHWRTAYWIDTQNRLILDFVKVRKFNDK